MESRRNGGSRRSLGSALAAVLAAAFTALIASPALAGRGEATPAPDAGAASARAHAKHARKGHAHGKAGEDATPARAGATGKRVKKTASRAGSKGTRRGRKADRESSKRRCAGSTIPLDRGGLEGQTLALVDCRDRPVQSAQVALSVLARPWGAQKPVDLPLHLPRHEAGSHHGAASRLPLGQAPGEIAPGVRLIDRGLLVRLNAIARRFPGRTLSVVSGYRPQSRGSEHQAGRAIDLRVAGVTNEELVTFCKTLPDTGCGYYPNSSFVHVDVRNPGTGGVSWIDSSGPGQAPHYVRQWPPPPEESSEAVLPPDKPVQGGTDDPYGYDAADEHSPTPDPDPADL